MGSEGHLFNKPPCCGIRFNTDILIMLSVSIILLDILIPGLVSSVPQQPSVMKKVQRSWAQMTQYQYKKLKVYILLPLNFTKHFKKLLLKRMKVVQMIVLAPSARSRTTIHSFKKINSLKKSRSDTGLLHQ